MPENLALGTVLQGAAGPMEVMAFAGAIVLSNLPEAAGGAAETKEDGSGTGRILLFWTGVAVLLGAAALVGATAFTGVSDGTNALVQCFAAGAIVASLAIEVFPDAFRDRNTGTGVAVAVGLLVAVGMHQLAG